MYAHLLSLLSRQNYYHKITIIGSDLFPEDVQTTI